METFLEQNEAYHESLKPGGSGNTVKVLFRKGRWATQMSEKVSLGFPQDFQYTISDSTLGSKFEDVSGYYACWHQLPCFTCLLLQVGKQTSVFIRNSLTRASVLDTNQSVMLGWRRGYTLGAKRVVCGMILKLNHRISLGLRVIADLQCLDNRIIVQSSLGLDRYSLLE
jgi:hypothetical protein